MNRDNYRRAIAAPASAPPRQATPGVYRFGWASSRLVGLGVALAVLLLGLWTFDLVDFEKIRLADAPTVEPANGAEEVAILSPPGSRWPG